MASEGNFFLAPFFILISGLFDRYDGRIARFFGVENTFGKELDSLADIVSFGVAPAVLIYSVCDFKSYGIIGYILTVIIPLAGAFRLARYNINTFTGVFTGVPITLVGSLIALFYLLNYYLKMPIAINVYFIGTVICISSYLMVSKISFKKV